MVKVGVVARVYIDCVFFGFCSYDRTIVSVVAVVFCLPDFKKFHGLFSVRLIFVLVDLDLESASVHDAILYTMAIIKISIV